MYIYISCHAASADIPVPLCPLLPIIHRFWLVLRATSRILTGAAICRFQLFAFARPSEGVHWRTSLLSSSLLLQQFCEGSRVPQTPEESRKHIGRNVVEIAIKMKTIARKLLMIKSGSFY